MNTKKQLSRQKEVHQTLNEAIKDQTIKEAREEFFSSFLKFYRFCENPFRL